jgi:2-methylcitrate dehydratase PrpD
MPDLPLSLTARLARHIVGYSGAKLDAAAFTVAKQCMLDWFGVTLAGSDEPVARILREELSTGARGGASIVGFDLRGSPVDAALVNGATSHALDYDDVHPLIGHPTAAILPAALAVGEAEGRSGLEVLRAFIAGYEAAGFIGSLVMRSHYERGFHSTATLGSFGSAAAAGLLMKLDEAQMAIALGLAGTQAAGLKSMFGTMAKPFHAGRAAANGVLAARLAARGFTANPGVLEVAQGFVVTQSDGDLSVDMPLPRPGSLVVETLFKYHAACYLTHSTIEAVKVLRRQLSLSGPDIAAIDIHVASGHLSVCNIPSPRTGLETKFSLRHTAALAACGVDTAAIGTYSDDNAVDATLTAVRERVTVHGDRPQGRDAHVLIKTRSGDAAETSLDVAIPDRDIDRQGERLASKFLSLAVPVIGSERAEALRRSIRGLESAEDIRALMAV